MICKSSSVWVQIRVSKICRSDFKKVTKKCVQNALLGLVFSLLKDETKNLNF